MRGVGKHFRFDDGGRAAAGYRGKAGDCVVRAIAIATGREYQEIYERVNAAALHERTGTRKRGKSNARTGVYRSSIKRVMKSLGWVWTPTMQIGSGCTVHLRADELPTGRLVVSVSKHLTAVIDGVIHDTHDCSRRGTRCVYGYWQGPVARSGRTVFRNPRLEGDFPTVQRLVKKDTPSQNDRGTPVPSNRQAKKVVEGPRRKKTFLEWLFG